MTLTNTPLPVHSNADQSVPHKPHHEDQHVHAYQHTFVQVGRYVFLYEVDIVFVVDAVVVATGEVGSVVTTRVVVWGQRGGLVIEKFEVHSERFIGQQWTVSTPSLKQKSCSRIKMRF